MDHAVRDAVRDDAVRDRVGEASPGLASVLAALGDRVAPVTMARERTLPVSHRFGELLADSGGLPGLVRGRIVSCAGGAATSVAVSLVAPAVAAGAWVAAIDVPTLGVDAASESGVAIERGAVGGDAEAARRWADVVAAAADGFEVLLVRVPDGLTAATVRKVSTRLQQRGVVMVVLGDPGGFVCDGRLESVTQTWEGLGAGWGHLRQRSVEVVATGRRVPGRRCRVVEFPDMGEAPREVPIDVEFSTAS